MKPSVLFFDVNETLLDLSPLKKHIEQALGGNEHLVALWFSTLLHYSLVANVTNDYKDFGDIGVGAIMMLAQINGIELTTKDAENAVLIPFKELPAYDDVEQGLKTLKDKDYLIVALTNSSQKSLEAKLKFAGIYEFFDAVLSAEPVKKFKPEMAVYHWAMQQVKVKPSDTLMIASHGWDIIGAQKAGMQTCFIERPGKQQFPTAPSADLSVTSLIELGSIL